MNDHTFPEYFIVAATNEAGLPVSFLKPEYLSGFWEANLDVANKFANYPDAQFVATDWADFLRLKNIGPGCTVLRVKNGIATDIGLDQFDEFGMPLF